MTENGNVGRFATGDQAAFEAAYDRYVRKIYDFLYFKTFDRETAEDLTQETFFKVFKSAKSFRGTTEAELKSWIYSVAYRTFVDHYRNFRETDELDGIAETHGKSEDHAARIDDGNTLSEVLAYLATIPEEHRDVVVMRVWDDLSYAEISEITGKSVDNCKKIVSRVLVQIQANVAYALLLCFFIP